MLDSIWQPFASAKPAEFSPALGSWKALMRKVDENKKRPLDSLKHYLTLFSWRQLDLLSCLSSELV